MSESIKSLSAKESVRECQRKVAEKNNAVGKALYELLEAFSEIDLEG